MWMALSLGSSQARDATDVVATKVQVRSVIRLLEASRYRQAAQVAKRILQRDPTSPAVVSLMGIALARSGHQADALPWLELGQGNLMYLEYGGASAHADALRAAGMGARAWRVRSAAIDPTWPLRRRVRARCHGIDDLLSAGRIHSARELGQETVLEAPHSATAHAFYATALLMNGSLLEAEFHQWIARLLSDRRIPRIAINEAWISAQYGDEVGARRAWSRAGIQRRNDPQIAAWYAEWLRRQDDLEAAWSVLDRTAIARQQHTALVLERIQILEGLGRANAAEKERKRAQQLFPTGMAN